jgi:hypothetical protein
LTDFQAASQRAAAATAVKGWVCHWQRKKRHQQLLLEAFRLALHRRRAGAFALWREYVWRRQQEQEAADQVGVKGVLAYDLLKKLWIHTKSDLAMGHLLLGILAPLGT